MSHRRTLPSLVLGLLAAGVPALIWAFIGVKQYHDPGAFHDQGGMFISLILFPLAIVAALVFGIPAAILGLGRPADPTADGSGRRLAYTGVGLSVLGSVLAAGTCIVPQALASALR